MKKKQRDKIPQLTLKINHFFPILYIQHEKINPKIIFTLKTGFKIPEEQSGKVK